MNTAISVSQETNLLNVLFNITKPQIANALYKKANYDLNIVQLLLALGAVEVAENVEVSHFEEDYLCSPIVNKNVTTAGAAGALKQFTIDPTGMYVGTNEFYAQVGDIVRFNNGVTGEITAIDVTTPSAPVLTIYPQSSSDSIPAVGALEQIANISSRDNEVNTYRKGAYRAPTKYTYPLQIINTTIADTGTAMAVKKWYDKYSDGKDIQAFAHSILNVTYEHWKKIGYAAWFSKPTTNTSVVPSGERGSMQGVIDWVKTSGAVNLPYTPGTFTTSTFRQIEAELDKYFCNKQYVGALGLGLARDINDALNNTLASNSMAYLKPGDNSSFDRLLAGDMVVGDGQTVSFNVSTYKSLSRVIHFSPMPQFSDPNLNVLDASGNPNGVDYTGIFIPIDKEVVKGNGTMPTSLWKLRYLPRPNTQQQYIQVTETGANAPTPTTHDDVRRMNLRSDIGNELFIPERWAAISTF